MDEDIISATRSRLLSYVGRYPEVSEKSGLSYSYISKFARGDRGDRPSLDAIQKLVSALDQMEAVNG